MRIILAVLLACAVRARALAPGEGVVVHFKDASALAGALVELTSEKITIDVGGARASWGMDAVERVETRETAVGRFQEAVRAAGDDPVKLAALAREARAEGLYTYSDELARRLNLPPDQTAQATPGAFQGPNPSPPAGLSPQPQPLGYAAQPAGRPAAYDAASLVYAPVVMAPPRHYSRAEQAAFLRRQAAEREARKSQVTNPVSDWQFRLQQALDRAARGLPFAGP